MAAAFNPLAGLQTADTPTKEERKAQIQISPKQVDLIKRLLTEKDLERLPAPWAALQAAVRDGKVDTYLATLTPGWGGTGSALIDDLFKAPRKSKPLPEATGQIERSKKLPTKFYAAVNGKRYYVQAPVQGKWGGWIFLKTGSDYYAQDRIGMLDPQGGWRGSDHGRDVLAAILADPGKAMAEYGLITGSCGYCGRKLEDPESVARGIGPVCMEKGWF